MKRYLPLVFGLVLIVVLMAHDLYDFLVTNEGIEYYASKPQRLLYVILVTVAASGMTFGISRISSASRWKLKLVVLGISGSVLPSFLFWAAVVLAQASQISAARIPWMWILSITLSALVIAALLWVEFFHVFLERPKQ